jgi:serine/threonine protein kinase
MTKLCGYDIVSRDKLGVTETVYFLKNNKERNETKIKEIKEEREEREETKIKEIREERRKREIQERLQYLADIDYVGKINLSGVELFVLSSIQHPNLLSQISNGFSTPFNCPELLEEPYSKTIYNRQQLPGNFSLLPYASRTLHFYDTSSLKEYKSIAYQLIKAVYCLHKNNVLHLDIKPANVFLFEENVKLGDFGNSSIVFSPYIPQENSAFVITRQYAPPDIPISKRSDIIFVDYSLDIYSLGILFLELLDRKVMNNLYSSIIDASDEKVNEERQKMIDYIKNVYLSSAVDSYSSLILSMIGPREKRPTALSLLSHPFFSDISESQEKIDFECINLSNDYPLHLNRLSQYKNAIRGLEDTINPNITSVAVDLFLRLPNELLNELLEMRFEGIENVKPLHVLTTCYNICSTLIESKSQEFEIGEKNEMIIEELTYILLFRMKRIIYHPGIVLSLYIKKINGEYIVSIPNELSSPSSMQIYVPFLDKRMNDCIENANMYLEYTNETQINSINERYEKK